jgi:hypothetical protein
MVQIKSSPVFNNFAASIAIPSNLDSSGPAAQMKSPLRCTGTKNHQASSLVANQVVARFGEIVNTGCSDTHKMTAIFVSEYCR